MPRHSKNSTACSVFTYQERKKTKEYGTQSQRLGNDSQQKFGMCCMYLHKLQDPMTCEKGHVFCKVCGVEHLVKQKKQMAEQEIKYKQYEKYLQETSEETKEEKDKEHKIVMQIKQFQKLENHFDPKTRQEILEDNQAYQQDKELNFEQYSKKQIQIEKNMTREQKIKNNFWMSENHKGVKEVIKKPDGKLKCPVKQDHDVKMKKLIPLKIKFMDTSSIESLCYTCSKQLQYQKVGVSKKCGHVQCLQCLQISLKESKMCGVCMEKCENSDIIELQSSQSAFSSHNSVQSQVYGSAMIV